MRCFLKENVTRFIMVSLGPRNDWMLCFISNLESIARVGKLFLFFKKNLLDIVALLNCKRKLIDWNYFLNKILVV